MDVRVGPQRKLSAKELMLLNCGIGEDSWEFLVLQGDQSSQSWRKSVLNSHWKDWCWSSSNLATWCKELTHSKRPWCWEGLRAQGEGDDRGWDSWMASLTRWTWVWANSESWWRTGSLACYSPWGRRVRHDWATELNQVIFILTDIFTTFKKLLHIYLMNTQKTNENKTKSWQWIDFLGGGRERRL